MSDRQPAVTQPPPKFTELNDLASERNGAKVVFATDDWFAEADNMLKASEPQWREGVFTECGKWMDGWETRRRRVPGHDWALVKLAVRGVVAGVAVDTAFFTGNYAPHFSLQAASLTPEEEALIPTRTPQLGTAASDEELRQVARVNSHSWTELVSRSPLDGGYRDCRLTHHAVTSLDAFTHVRLNVYPDGGIARLRVFGVAQPAWRAADAAQLLDLASLRNGGVCLGFSDAHYGHPRNVIGPGRAANMADGWETARRLDRPAVLEADAAGVLLVPGCEWAVFRLGACGAVQRVELDTHHFKGNFPDSVRIDAAQGDALDADTEWTTLLASSKLGADRTHVFGEGDLRSSGPCRLLRVTIAPDGGISRLRVFARRV